MGMWLFGFIVGGQFGVVMMALISAGKCADCNNSRADSEKRPPDF